MSIYMTSHSAVTEPFPLTGEEGTDLLGQVQMAYFLWAILYSGNKYLGKYAV